MAELQIMGSGDAFGSGGKLQTCFWLNWDGKNILVDIGATSSVAFKRNEKKIDDIDAIFISHLHGDHIGGLPFLLMELAYSTKNTHHVLEIFGPKGIKERIRALQELLYPGSLKYTDPVSKFTEYTGIDEFQNFKIESFDVKHSELSVPKGLRISLGNKVFSFSGDGEWSENLYQVAEGANIFICECYNYEDNTPGHLNYKTLIQKKGKINCDEIYLSHPGPDLLANIEKVQLPVLQDNQIIEF